MIFALPVGLGIAGCAYFIAQKQIGRGILMLFLGFGGNMVIHSIWNMIALLLERRTKGNAIKDNTMNIFRKEIEFNKPIQTVFAFFSDPVAWHLCRPPVEELSQRSITIGTTWKFDKRRYKCVGLAYPSRFSLETDDLVITYSFTAIGDSTTNCEINIKHQSGSSSSATSLFAERHWELVIELKKTLEGTLGSPYINRVAFHYENRRDGKLPSVRVKTEATIKRDSETIFRIIVANPHEFWRWMTDRCNPGGLTVSGDWPKQDSYYRYKKRHTACLLVLIKPWDIGTVRIIHIIPNRLVIIEEHEESLGEFITTTFDLEPIEDDSGEKSTKLKSEYVFTPKHWFYRRLFYGSGTFAFFASQMVKQTANIVAVCESSPSEIR